MSAYELPTALEIGGKPYAIRSDFRAVLDILMAMNDPELDEQGKAVVMLQILFPDWETIPPELTDQALEKACAFIDCGQKGDGKPQPRLLDWEQDAPIIIPAVNNVAHTEIRAMPYLHWWSFWGYFMGIGESLFSSVVSIRQKKARGKKLEKWEQEYYRENKALIDLRRPESRQEQEVKENMLKWL